MPGGGERLTAMWTRSFIVLWFAMFVAMIGIAMISPLIPVYVREELGGPEIAVALSFAGVTLPMLFLSPIVGRLGDRFGLKPFVAGGFLVYGLGASGYMIASTWEHVVLFRMLSGIGAAAIFPMTLAYVGRLAPPGREGAYAGAFAVSQVLGFGTGPLIGGVIRDAAGTFTVFAAMALLLIGTGLATFVLLPSAERGAEPGAARGGDGSPTATDQAARGPERSWAQLLRFAPVQAAMTVQTVVALGWGAGATFLAIYVISEDGLGTESATFVGLLLASRALIGGVLQPWFGRLADRVSRLRLVMIGLIVSSTGHFLIPNVPSATFEVGTLVLAPWLLALFVLIGLAEAIAFPAQQAIFVDVGRRVGMGSVMGLTQMGSSLGFLAGSLVGAGVVELFGLAAIFRYAGLVVLAGALLFFVLMRRAREDFAELRAAAREDARFRAPGPPPR